jgi:hypothetical protein
MGGGRFRCESGARDAGSKMPKQLRTSPDPDWGFLLTSILFINIINTNGIGGRGETPTLHLKRRPKVTGRIDLKQSNTILITFFRAYIEDLVPPLNLSMLQKMNRLNPTKSILHSLLAQNNPSA